MNRAKSPATHFKAKPSKLSIRKRKSIPSPTDDLQRLGLQWMPNCISLAESQALIQHLTTLEYAPKQDTRVKMFGKWIDVPREQIAFALPGVRGYKFNVQRTQNAPMPEFLEELRQKAIKVTGRMLNFALVNYYASGENYIGLHQDKTTDLIPGSDIVSFSFGASRVFQIANHTKKVLYEMGLENGSCLVMSWPFNQLYYHGIRQEKTQGVGPRWNITFRNLIVDE